MDTTQQQKMSLKSYLNAIGKVLSISFKLSPAAIAIKIFTAALNAVMPLLMAFFAAQTITSITAAFNSQPGAKTAALWYVTLTALIGLLDNIFTSITGYIDQVLRFKIEARISDSLYERFIALDFWRYDDKNTTDLYEKAQDFTRFFAYIFDRVTQLFISLFGMFSAIIALIVVSPWLSIAIFLAIMPSMVVQYKMSRFSVRLWRENVTARRKQTFIEYNMIQPQVISELRLYNLAKTILRLRKKYRDQDQLARFEQEKKFIKWRVLGNFLESGAQLSSLIWIVLQIAAKAQPIGQFVYVQQLVSRALGSADRFISDYGSIDEDLAKLVDYNEFMALPVVSGRSAKKIKSVETIRFENVSFKYPASDKLVLKNINFTVKKGEHIAIVGENGAGKTTLIKLLLGFYPPSSGRILINDIDLSSIDSASWHQQIGVLLQDFTRFYFLNAGENVSAGDITVLPKKSKIDRALELAEAKNLVYDLPKKLDTPLAPWLEEDGATDLSGGQWQRLGLARNFYRQAQIVILDEPTSAIDALAEAKIFDRLFDPSNKKTVITISHRLTTIEAADTIFVLKDGQIVQSGPHKLLAKDAKHEYARMFRRQLKGNDKNHKSS